MANMGLIIKRLLEIIVVIIMSIMSLMVFGNVVLRYLANSSITSSEELSRFLFVWLTFLAAILCYHENQHICVDFIIKKFNFITQKVCKLIVDFLILGCSIFFAYGSYLLTEIGVDELSPVTLIPMSTVYIAGVFQRKLNEENQAKQIAEFQKAGVEVIMEVDQKPFKDVTFDAVSKFYTDQCGDKLIKDINAELAK